MLLNNISGWDEKVNSIISLNGYDPEYGARPIKRKIRNIVEDKISELIMTNEAKDGDTLLIKTVNNNIDVSVK